MLEFQTITFYLFSAVTLAAALGVILVSNPVYAALFLVLAFVSSAGIWLLLHAEFLAIALVLVYVGAVMVLFLFVLMMLDINLARLREGFWRYLPLAVLVMVLFTVQVATVLVDIDLVSDGEGNAESSISQDNTRALGEVLYTEYIYPFELAAIILLVAIVSAVALTLRRRKNTKYADPAQQVRVSKKDRVRLTSISSDTPL